MEPPDKWYQLWLVVSAFMLSDTFKMLNVRYAEISFLPLSENEKSVLYIGVPVFHNGIPYRNS